jgi:hypothetical protein
VRGAGGARDEEVRGLWAGGQSEGRQLHTKAYTRIRGAGCAGDEERGCDARGMGRGRLPLWEQQEQLGQRSGADVGFSSSSRVGETVGDRVQGMRFSSGNMMGQTVGDMA